MSLVNIFSLIAMLLYCTRIPIVSIIYIHSEKLGHRLCWNIPENLRTCDAVTHGALEEFQTLDDYPNITSPRIFIAANLGLSFTVRFMNAKMRIPKVRTFAMMGEGTEVEIDLMDTTTEYTIVCSGYASASKVSGNIVMSPDTKHFITYKNYDYPDVYKISVFNNNGKILQSGRFTCVSTDEPNSSETLKIFTRPSSQIDMSPFVTYGESTIQNDKKGNGFIVPCATNYKMQSPPDLLWKKNAKDNFTMLTSEEMKSFNWDPQVGFQFTRSVREWEMYIIGCRFGSFETIYLPTSSRFQESVHVTVSGDQISCSSGSRNISLDLLLASTLVHEQARYYSCLTYIGCDLQLHVGILYLNSPSRASSAHTFGILELDDANTYGVLSCISVHSYDGKNIPEMTSKIFFLGLDSEIYLLPGSYPNQSVIQIDPVEGPFYRNHTELELYHEFTCTTIDFVLFGEVYFILRHQNFTDTVTQGPEKSMPGLSTKTKFDMKLDTNVTHAICLMLTMDGKIISAEIPLQITDAFAPLIDNNTPNSRTFKVGELNDFTLTCPITGAPPPRYQWTMDMKHTDLVEGYNGRNLTFREFHENMTGKYRCKAWNEYGSNSFEFHVRVLPQDAHLSTTSIAGIGIATVLCFILLCTAVVLAFKYFRAKEQVRDLTPEEASEFLSGVPVTEGTTHGDGSEIALQMPFTKRIELNSVVVDRGSILGRGQFGIVYRGIFHGEAVAVKTFKRAVTLDEFRAGLLEVKLMHYVGEHPNIVKFIGADVTNIERRHILIVMELSLFGSLERHLRMLRQTNYTNTRPQYANVDDRLTHVSLFGYCEQIAFAMEHLESKRVIHGDLAVRNVLVFSGGLVKVTDFGYSRQMYENNIYKSKQHRLLPWRSASIELLRQMEFSRESDIWAFGVTVWEIFTFGNVPFAGERWNDRFVRQLENGLRLQRPSGLSDTQFSFLKECWAVEKSMRPSYSSLKCFLATEKQNLQRALDTTVV